MLLPMVLLPPPMMLKPTHVFFVAAAELQERVQFQTRWSLLMFDGMMAVFLLLEHLVVEPRHTHDHQKVVEKRSFFQNVV